MIIEENLYLVESVGNNIFVSSSSEKLSEELARFVSGGLFISKVYLLLSDGKRKRIKVLSDPLFKKALKRLSKPAKEFKPVISFKKFLEISESLGWSVLKSKSKGFYIIELYKYSPAGEDFGFSIDCSKLCDVIQKVCSYVDDFDTEEHVLLMLESRNRPSIKTLVTDDIKKMLIELKKSLFN